MLRQTTKNLVVLDKNNPKDQYADFLTNSALLDFRSLDKVVEVPKDSIRRCTDASCKSILSKKDREWLWEIREYIDNFDFFEATFKLPKERLAKPMDPQNKVWICRYCGSHQIINTKAVHFLDENVKYPLSDQPVGGPVRDPIILVLVDWSSSMQKAAIEGVRQNMLKQHKTLIDLVDNSILAKELQRREKEESKRVEGLCPDFPMPQPSKNDLNISKNDLNISKNHMLLAILGQVIKGLKSKVSATSTNQQTNKIKFGFIFFNDYLFLPEGIVSTDYPIVCSSDPSNLVNEGAFKFYCGETWSQKRLKKCNYNCYDDLYKLGKESKVQYPNLKSFKEQDIKFDDIITEGQTALGPALAVALGIVSNHGPSSTIMIITDGLANNGILSSQNINSDVSKICQDLEKQKCTLGIFQWNQQSYMATNNLDPLTAKAPHLITKFQVSLKTDNKRISMDINTITEMAFNRRITAQIMKEHFIHNTKFISFQSSDKKNKPPTFSNPMGAMINKKSALWFDIQINASQIHEANYNKQPICTQSFVKWSPVDSPNTTYLFISEIEHFLTKSKNRMFDSINNAFLEERMLRYELEGGCSLQFDQGSVKSVNQSMNSANRSLNRRYFDVDDANEDSRIEKAEEFGISFKSEDPSFR